MILIKLGGSIITNKNRPLTARREMIEGIAKSLQRIHEPMILVHGGGSYGHYWSVKYGMHTKQDTYDILGVAAVKASMVKLNSLVLEGLLKGGLHPYCLPPSGFMSAKGLRPVTDRIREIGEIADYDMIPVTFGDALWTGSGMSYILSGDKIMTHLARVLRPRMCIFVLNEDGLYRDMESKKVIREITSGQDAPLVPVSSGQDTMDVTGGMARKVREATLISRSGAASSVCLVNGSKPERIVQAVQGRRFVGTIFVGKNGDRHGDAHDYVVRHATDRTDRNTKRGGGGHTDA